MLGACFSVIHLISMPGVEHDVDREHNVDQVVAPLHGQWSLVTLVVVVESKLQRLEDSCQQDQIENEPVPVELGLRVRSKVELVFLLKLILLVFSKQCTVHIRLRLV